MANLIKIDSFINKYNDNLLSVNSLLNNNPTVNFNSNTGSYDITSTDSYSENAKCIEFTEVQNIVSGSFVQFDLGDALEYTATKDGNYIFQYSVYNKIVNSSNSLPTEFKLKLYVNTILVEEFTNTLDINELEEQKYHTFTQSFNLLDTDVVNFAFEFFAPSVGSPNPNFTFNVGGFKLEIDDKFLSGLPTIFSYPFIQNNIPNTFVLVDDISNLPNAVAGVITLEDNYTYYITSTIDLLGNRLVGGSNTTILGSSSENSILTSTGLGVGVPLLTSIYTTPIRNICFKDVDTSIDFDGATNPNNMDLDWTGVNFVNVPNIGVVKDASNFIFDKGEFLNSKGLSFDGNIETVGFGNSLFSGDGLAGNLLELLSTCTITRRFRTIYSSVVAFGSTTGINVNVSATIPTESYILDTINFSGGGTYLSGVDVTDNKTLFVNCKGVQNSAEISEYFMNGNITQTVVASTSVAYKVLGTTTSSTITQKFTNTNNRATYVGSITRAFLITATISFESGNNNQIGCYIAKNGSISLDSEVYGTTSGTGRAENVTIQTLVELSENDYIEIFVENESSITNILVTNLNVIIK
jgi:hypothetical protein